MGLFSGVSNVLKGIGGAINPVTPLLGVGAELLGAFSAKSAQEDANRTNIELQRSNQAWEENLASTAHQREVADLKAAGLNPILSARLGGSATPVVAPARVESLAPTYLNSARQFSERSLATRSLMADLQLKKAQTEAASAQATHSYAGANVSNTTAQGVAYDNARKALELEVIGSRVPLEKYKIKERYKSRSWDLMLDDLKRGSDALNPFSGGSTRGAFGRGDSISF